MNLIKSKTAIGTCMVKLKILKSCIGNRSFQCRKEFPNLSTSNQEKKISDGAIRMYCEHPNQLHTDMENRFVDLTTLNIPHWLSSPLRVPNYDEPGLVEEEIEELMLLNTDFELHPKLQVSFQDFWLQNKISESYPALWSRVNIFFIAFPTSYLVEQGFSAVVQILGKQRQKLD
ncbi:unnamed protein product, partial [Meganyctiphanes norvegica]